MPRRVEPGVASQAAELACEPERPTSGTFELSRAVRCRGSQKPWAPRQWGRCERRPCAGAAATAVAHALSRTTHLGASIKRMFWSAFCVQGSFGAEVAAASARRRVGGHAL